MTQRILNYTYKLFQGISLAYFPLDNSKHDVNIHSTFVIHKTALGLHACGTDLGARSDSHNYGLKEVKIYNEAFKSQFTYLLYISINAFMM